MIESGHTPNPHILVCYSTREFASAQLDIERMEAGGAPRAPSARYEVLAQRRDRLMCSYKKGEMTRREYLVQMGSVSLKSLRELSKKGIQPPKKGQAQPQRPAPQPQRSAPPAAPSAAAAAEAMDDSFSETRVMSPLYSDQDSDVEQPDPFPARAFDPRRAIQPIIEARQKAQKCSKCGAGFHLSRNLHLVCGQCTRYQHKRCAGVAKDRDPFLCLGCLPDTILDADLGK